MRTEALTTCTTLYKVFIVFALWFYKKNLHINGTFKVIFSRKRFIGLFFTLRKKNRSLKGERKIVLLCHCKPV